ncbi:MAG TPA: EAL domain-containing protein [Macromonas sp.]|nr:EAL domain-containing protein [Macromonas sp.]
MLSRATIVKGIHRLWFAPELGLVHHRREQRMRLVASLMMLVMGAGWGIYFSLHGLWFIVVQDLALMAGALVVITLTWLNRGRLANVVLFTVLLTLICGIAAVMDVPTLDAPRTTHLYLLPLSVASLLAFRDDGFWLRYGLAFICLAAFTALAASTGTPLPGYNLPDEVRVSGSWVQAGAAVLMFITLIHIMQTDATEQTTLERELLEALVQEQFVLHYQPQVDSQGQVIGAEALLRWQHPERGLLMPGQFIELAEQSGLIVPIGKWVLETACAQLRAWSSQPARQGWTLAVNISQKQFAQSDFVQEVLQMVERYNVPAHRLELELTETMFVVDIEATASKMAVLVARGITFSLDDFGTGYSSLSYLKKLPLAKLKIDQSFVADVLTDPSSQAIVRTVIALGQSMGLAVIAEGVETKEQHRFLLDNGCLLFQGYLLSRPVPLRQLEAFGDRRAPVESAS